MNGARWILAGIAALLVAALAVYLMLLPPYLAAAPQTEIVLSQVTVFNPGQGRRDAQTITIKYGLIAEIRDARPDDPPPLCQNCIVMPGLSDAHVHTPPAIALGNQRLFALM
jgi:hypothetical protein